VQASFVRRAATETLHLWRVGFLYAFFSHWSQGPKVLCPTHFSLSLPRVEARQFVTRIGDS
jgi:hypothetical protein